MTNVNTRRIRRIAPLQLAKTLGVMYGLLGLVFAPFILLAAFVAPQSERDGALGTLFGVGFAIFFPIMYAVLGFISGILGAAIYNLVTKWVGGIEVELADVELEERAFQP